MPTKTNPVRSKIWDLVVAQLARQAVTFRNSRGTLRADGATPLRKGVVVELLNERRPQQIFHMSHFSTWVNGGAVKDSIPLAVHELLGLRRYQLFPDIWDIPDLATATAMIVNAFAGGLDSRLNDLPLVDHLLRIAPHGELASAMARGTARAAAPSDVVSRRCPEICVPSGRDLDLMLTMPFDGCARIITEDRDEDGFAYFQENNFHLRLTDQFRKGKTLFENCLRFDHEPHSAANTVLCFVQAEPFLGGWPDPENDAVDDASPGKSSAAAFFALFDAFVEGMLLGGVQSRRHLCAIHVTIEPPKTTPTSRQE